MLLGTHVSIAGGYLNSLIEAKRLGIDAIQIFTKNQRFWQEKLVSEEEGDAFKNPLPKYGVQQAFSHAIYLISLGSENEDIVQKSLLSLVAEMERCRVLGLTHTVLHPGFAGKGTPKEAIRRILVTYKNGYPGNKRKPGKNPPGEHCRARFKYWWKDRIHRRND